MDPAVVALLGNDLYEATRRGKDDRVGRILSREPGFLNARLFQLHKSSQCTLLMAAAFEGRANVVDLLLALGANIDQKDYDGWTALLHAARNGHKQVVSLLLRRGAEAMTLSSSGRNALMVAATHGRVGVVRALLPHYCRQDVDKPSDDGRTALHMACLYGQTDVARVLLVEGGADPNLTDPLGRTPKQIARNSGHTGCLELMEWYQKEVLERPYVLHRARRMHDDRMRRERFPSAPVPTYVRQRAQSGEDLPAVAVVPQRPLGGLARFRRRHPTQPVWWWWKDGDKHQEPLEEEEERAATVTYLIQQMPWELHTELMMGLTGKMHP